MTINNPAPREPRPSLEVHEVDPTRLARGEWSHEHQRTIGEGDIAASYSGDRIGMGQPLRAPFTHHGRQWVCVSFRHGSTSVASAYRLVHLSQHEGKVTNYTTKVVPDSGRLARSDPLGFYHGIAVKRGRETFILCGPPAEFVAGEPQQRSLFD